MKFTIGEGLTCDLNRLVDTRLLVQANSGGGKSWCLRRMLEQTHGHVQHLVIDPEGEFASLRERFDYVHAAKSGADTAADPRSATLLAERLLELKVSAILDIYELKAHERVRFVRLFLEALVNAPKSLWHPALVIVDEAHVYCPQTGEAESAGAVKDLATRGRKRGFCAVLATQRLSKLHKDAAAECNNKLIGRTGLDVDMKRAADELGLMGREDVQQLRALDPGEFFAFGPAFPHTGVKRIRVGANETTHPKAGGHRAFEAPPPTAAVKKLLPSLADLPAEAADRERSIADLKAELAQTKRDLTIARKEQPKPQAETKTVEKFVLKDGQLARLEKIYDRMLAEADKHGKAMALLWDQQAEEAKALLDVLRSVAGVPKPPPATVHQMPRQPHARRVAPAPATSRPARVVPASSNGDQSDVTPAKQRILDALAFLHGLGVDQVDKTQLALMAGVPPTSGGYKNNLGALRSDGFIAYPTPGSVSLTDAGAAIADHTTAPQTTEDLHDAIRAKLPPAKWRILDVLIRTYPKALDKTALAAACGVPETSGGYKNNLGSLRSLGLIEYPQPGTVAAQPVLFLEDR